MSGSFFGTDRSVVPTRFTRNEPRRDIMRCSPDVERLAMRLARINGMIDGCDAPSLADLPTSWDDFFCYHRDDWRKLAIEMLSDMRAE